MLVGRRSAWNREYRQSGDETVSRRDITGLGTKPSPVPSFLTLLGSFLLFGYCIISCILVRTTLVV